MSLHSLPVETDRRFISETFFNHYKSRKLSRKCILRPTSFEFFLTIYKTKASLIFYFPKCIIFIFVSHRNPKFGLHYKLWFHLMKIRLLLILLPFHFLKTISILFNVGISGPVNVGNPKNYLI